MAGPSPRDDYNPVQTVQPSTGVPNDFLQTRANPNSFGAQVGQGVEKVGSALGDVGQQAINTGIQFQGVLNEHASNQADLQLAVQSGNVMDQYRSLTGLAAANAKDKAVSDIMTVNDKIRSSLGNPAAQRAYDQLAARRLSFSIADMNTYAATQTVSALHKGNADIIQMASDSAGRITGNPDIDGASLGAKIGDVKHAVAADMTAPVYGTYRGLSVTQDKDGTLQFDQSTQEGKIAQADYQNTLNIQLGKVYTNRADALATDINHGSYIKADQFVHDNQANMPPATFNQLSQKFYGPAKTEQIHGNNESILAQAHSDYINQTGVNTEAGPVSSNNIGNVKTSSGTFAQPMTPQDGVILATNNLRSDTYKGLTLQQIGQTWVGKDQPPQKITDWVDTVSKVSGVKPGQVPNLSDPNTLNAMMKGIMTGEKSAGDQKLFSDQTINTGVSSALAGQKANLSQVPSGSRSQPRNEVDYIGMQEPRLIQQARDLAEKQGLDATQQDQAAQQMETRINEIRSAQQGEARALSDGIISRVMDTQNNGKNPMTSEFPLMYGDQQTKQDYAQALNLNPFLANTVRQLTAANAVGQSKTYGSNFYPILSDVLSGKVTDASQLGQYGIGGDKAPLSGSGFQVLQKQIEDLQTPTGSAFAQAELAWIQKARGVITGANIAPGINSEALQTRFNTWLQQTLPQIQAGRAGSKSPTEMFDDPKSPLNQSILAPTEAQLRSATLQSFLTPSQASTVNNQSGTPQTPVDLSHYKTVTDLAADVKSGKVSRQDAVTYSHQQGWTKAPERVLPESQVK